VRPGSRHDTAAARYHGRARCRHRHHAPHPADWRVPALVARAGMGTGGDGPARHRRAVRDVGRRRRDDDPQGPVGNALPQGHPLGEPRGEATGSPGLDRAVGVQSSLFWSRGVRLGPPPGFSQGLEDSDVPGRDRDQRAGAAAVNPAPLGVFDSGIGGLTVARAVFERLPHESVIYFGDTARVPYGPKWPDAAICVQACPLFVPLVEEGWFDHSATELIAREYLAPLQRAGVDVLVLGCTHYPLLKPLLARVLGPGVTLVDSAEETAKVVAE